VNVGSVTAVVPRGLRTEATISLDSEFAPLPSDARAILRQKTLLGETYVELTPGSDSAPPLPEDGRLAVSQVSPTVELDEIFRSFDAKTRESFRTWMQDQATAVEGRGEDLNEALGNLAPFAEDAAGLVDTLNTQEGALRRVVSNTGEVFGALAERRGQLRGLIRNANTVFGTTARRDQRLQELFRVLPTFSRESEQTLDRLERFARDTDPLIDQLRPAAREMSPTLQEVRAISPDLRGFFEELGPLTRASRAGFPAAERVIDDLRPFLAQVDPTMRELIPILEFVGLYRRELTSFLANSVAATQARTSFGEPRYLRVTNPLNLENLASYPRRLGANRANPYQLPGAFEKLASGLEVFDDRGCDNPTPSADRITGGEDVPEGLLEGVKRFAFAPGPRPAAPPCRLQSTFDFGGERTKYPHVRRAP
jgi:ABC-type transporter Mla subunit MlaD